MATVMPKNELVKRASAYISDCLKDEPDKPLHRILEEAAMRFNLSPLDSAALERLFAPEKNDGTSVR